MAKNKSINNAKKQKDDEFYTQLSDIEHELENYREHFKDRHIFLNCDDPEESMFWKYFEMNFELFGLKQLTATHYHATEKTYRLDIKGDLNGDGKITCDDIVKTPLKQNGDFRSDESIELLKECDIVVTNPPFSLFREYINQLVKYEKHFLIIGPLNAMKYNEVFPYIKNEDIWLGTKRLANFTGPNGEAKLAPGIWLTTLDYKKRHEELILYEKYTSEEYPKYDNYDAINCKKTKSIPINYFKEIGVPITYLEKHNPDQFKIIGKLDGSKITNFNFGVPTINKKVVYTRIIIKRK